MSQHLTTFNANQNSSETQKIHGTKQKFWASDDVHRVALRNPTLYRTNNVPRVGMRFPMGQHMNNRGMA